MAQFDDVDADIEATLAGLRESLFTLVVCYILEPPGTDSDEFYAKNLGAQTVTISGAPNAESAAEAAEEAIEEYCEKRYGKEPWAVWVASILVGAPQQVRVPVLEFEV